SHSGHIYNIPDKFPLHTKQIFFSLEIETSSSVIKSGRLDILNKASLTLISFLLSISYISK
ncbi:unnamed protein product, partial [marine sediment metagenome]